MKTKYDYQRLKGRMKEYYGTIGNFAKELGISRQSLSFKVTNRVRFSYEELQIMIDKLHIQPEEIQDIFFSTKS